MNSSATVTVGTWVAHRKDSNSESDSMFQNESDLELMQQEHNPQDRIRKQLHSQTAFCYWVASVEKIENTLQTMKTPSFQF